MLPKERKVYVASSWKNPIQIAVVHALRATGMEVYDFKNPTDGVQGFHWSDVSMPSYDSRIQEVSVDEYLQGIQHEKAVEGFKHDFEAMNWANTFVLVLPCGRSAHLELGWAVGRKETFILLDDPVTPELMYKMVDFLAPSLFDLLGLMGVED